MGPLRPWAGCNSGAEVNGMPSGISAAIGMPALPGPPTFNDGRDSNHGTDPKPRDFPLASEIWCKLTGGGRFEIGDRESK